MSNTPYTTVVIPAYRARSTILRAVNSVIETTEGRAQVVVVVDGTLDDSEALVRDTFPFVTTLLNVENMGAQFSRNRGLSTVETETVMFLDADDFVEGRLLPSLHRAILEESSSLAFGPTRKASEKAPLSCARIPPQRETPNDILVRWLRGRSRQPSCGVMWRTSEVRRIGGWNELMTRNQDGELILRALVNDCVVSTVSDGCGVYWQHEGVRISRKASKDAFECQKLIVQEIEKSALFRESPEVRDALNVFRIRVALRAYRQGLDDIAQEWVDEWRVNGGTLGLHLDDGLSRALMNIAYVIFGFKKGELLMRSLTRKV